MNQMNSCAYRRLPEMIPRVNCIGSVLIDVALLSLHPGSILGSHGSASWNRTPSAFFGVGVIRSSLCYKHFTIIEAGFMFTPEELLQAKIFACLDQAECARLANTIADVRLEPGEWLFREGAPAAFYVLFEGSLRMVLDVLGKQPDLRLVASPNLVPRRAPG
jgi:hypothetical protein